MKKKCLAVTLIMIMILSMFSGCGKDSGATADSNTIYGEVSKIENNVVTIKVGTMNKMERSSNKGRGGEKPTNTGDMSKDNKDQSGQRASQGGNRPSMLELTGEEKEVKVTDSTVITSRQRGGKMGNPPVGQSGEQTNNDNPPEMPSEDRQNDKVQDNPPDMPEGESMERQETEEISLNDISEGDVVAITLDDDGNAKEIAVMSMGGMNPPENNEESTADNYAAVDEYITDKVGRTSELS